MEIACCAYYHGFFDGHIELMHATPINTKAMTAYRHICVLQVQAERASESCESLHQTISYDGDIELMQIKIVAICSDDDQPTHLRSEYTYTCNRMIYDSHSTILSSEDLIIQQPPPDSIDLK